MEKKNINEKFFKEKFFKVKRWLAKKGIGNPLMTLMATSGEIKIMKETDKIKIPNVEPKKSPHGKYGIEVKMGSNYHLLPKMNFGTKEKAFAWAMWNYKGRKDNFRIVEKQQNAIVVF